MAKDDAILFGLFASLFILISLICYIAARYDMKVACPAAFNESVGSFCMRPCEYYLGGGICSWSRPEDPWRLTSELLVGISCLAVTIPRVRIGNPLTSLLFRSAFLLVGWAAIIMALPHFNPACEKPGEELYQGSICATPRTLRDPCRFACGFQAPVDTNPKRTELLYHAAAASLATAVICLLAVKISLD